MKEIKLTRGLVTLVDDADFVYLSQWKWYAANCRGKLYAARMARKSEGFAKRTAIYMHRALAASPEFSEVDHKNRNSLDNRRENLEACSHSKNMVNRVHAELRPSYLTGGQSGAYWNKQHEKWEAQIQVNRKKVFLGYYESEALAISARVAAEKKYYP